MSSLSLPRESLCRVLQYLPLVTSPAVKQGEYEEDKNLILIRAVSGLALSILAAVGLYWAFPAFALVLAKHDVLAICAAYAWTLVLGVFESWRANVEIDRLAAEEYTKQIPSAKATAHLCASPKAFQYLLDRKEDLGKQNSAGSTLIKRIFSGTGARSEVRQMLLKTDIDLFQSDSKGVDPFTYALQDHSFHFPALRDILKSGKIKAAEINNETQASFFKSVFHGPEKIALLCEYGFNIDAKDAEGNTPLMNWAKECTKSVGPCWASPFFAKALNMSAHTELTNNEGQKAWDLVKEGSLAQKLLQQTKTCAKTSICRDLLGQKKGSAEEKEAVVEYLTKPVPSFQAMHTICSSFNAVSLLVSYGPPSNYLDKFDAFGDSLLSGWRAYQMSFDVFKLLVDSGFSMSAGYEHTGFMRAVHGGKIDRLKYVLDKLDVRNLTNEVQAQMWSSIDVNPQEMARFLKTQGFDPNARDASGQTALMHFVQEENLVLAKLQALLDAGADPRCQNLDGDTAIGLANKKIPRIRALLENHLEAQR